MHHEAQEAAALAADEVLEPQDGVVLGPDYPPEDEAHADEPMIDADVEDAASAAGDA